MEILEFCSWKYFRQNQAKASARPRPRRERLTHGRADRARGPRRPEAAPGRAERGRGKGRYLRPGWLLPARIRRTRSGRPSRQLSAVDTRKICPPCTEKLRSSAGTALPAQPATGPAATAARGELRRAQPTAGAHPLHDPAVYLHPVPVHGWRCAEQSLAEAPAALTGCWRGPAHGEPSAKQLPGPRTLPGSTPGMRCGAGGAGAGAERSHLPPALRRWAGAAPLQEQPPGPSARAAA